MYFQRKLFTLGWLLTTLIATSTVHAKPEFATNIPADYPSGAISCGSCHMSPSPNDDNDVSLSFGVAFDQTDADDDFPQTIVTAYRQLELKDSDGDGFSNIQEIMAGTDVNFTSSKPKLTGTSLNNASTVAALPIVNETVQSLSSSTTTPASITALIPAGDKNLGGTVDFTSTNLTAATAGNTATADFIFSTGGVQIGDTVYFIDDAGLATQVPVTADTYGNLASISLIPTATGSSPSSVGTITLTIADEGPFDLYSQSNFIAKAIARTISFTETNVFDVYAGVSPNAKISALAVIDQYAIIDAYAIVDNYAYIGPGVEVYSYAYIGPNVDVYANVDPYVEVLSSVSVGNPVTMPTFTGIVQSRFAVVNTPPTAHVVGITDSAATNTGSGNSTVGSGSTTGGEKPITSVHCMTSGLATQGLLFLSLIIGTLLVRRTPL